MNNLIFGINLVLPLFIIILVGAFIRRKGILNDASMDSITSLVFYIALPAKLFMDTVKTDFTQVFDINFILFTVIGTIISFLLLFFLVPFFVKDNGQSSAIIHAGFRGNFVFIGIPLIENILGKSPVGQASLIIVFVIPLYNILGVFVPTYFSNKNYDFKISSLVIDIFKNPMIVSILAALPISLLNTDLPSFVNVSLDILGRASSPLALLLIGASLRMDVFKGEYIKIILTALYKTVLSPLVAVTLAMTLNFSIDEIISIFVLFSIPCANNVYIMTKKLGGDADLVSSITIASLISTMLTLPIGITLLGKVGMIHG